MHRLRAGLVIAVVFAAATVMTATLATPALAADANFDDQAAERWAAPALPTPAAGTDWRTCRLSPDASGFLETGGSPCDPCTRYPAPAPYPASYPTSYPRVCAPQACCPQECCPRGCWGFRVGLMGWLPGLNGGLTLGGRSTDVDFNWTDWFDNLDKIDFALELYVGVRYNRWHLDLGGLRMKLGDSVPIESLQGATLDAELTMVIAKGTIGYEFYRKSTSSSRPFPCLTAIGYVGARYYSMDAEARIVGQGVNKVYDWVDPLVGARVRYDLSRPWSLFVDGDIGGFGVGSDLCWSVKGGAEWRATDWLALQAGWNVLDVDYTTGSGAGLFVFDMTLSGPFVNVMFNF